MESVNAFIGRTEAPTEADLESALGPSIAAWREFLDWMAKQHRIEDLEWKSYSVKAGWALRVYRKRRTIVWLSPCKGYFRVGFVLGPRAVDAAREHGASKPVLDAIEAAPRYPEGYGLRFVAKKARDLAPMRELVDIKLAN